MNNLNPFIAGITGAALAITLFAPVGDAAETYVNPHQQIYAAARDVGYDVSNDADDCKEPGLLGFVAHIGRKPLKFVICTNNAPHPKIAFTTIRHEGVHVAQICKGGMLFPQHEKAFIGRAQDEGWHILAYPERKWGTEAEARVLANEWTAQEVANAIRTFCF